MHKVPPRERVRGMKIADMACGQIFGQMPHIRAVTREVLRSTSSCRQYAKNHARVSFKAKSALNRLESWLTRFLERHQSSQYLLGKAVR